MISGKVNAKAAVDGDMDEGFVYAGQGVGLIDDVPSVAELFQRMLSGAASIRARLTR
jgi:enoyl-[acyl-carrier protein] reductase II